MPSVSAKQKRFMAAAAHDPKFARKAGVPVKVAKEYYEADNRKPSRGKEFTLTPKAMGLR
jgi:hypothetical protein